MSELKLGKFMFLIMQMFILYYQKGKGGYKKLVSVFVKIIVFIHKGKHTCFIDMHSI